MKFRSCLLVLAAVVFSSCLSSGENYDFLKSDEPFSFSRLRRMQTHLDWPVAFRVMSDGEKIAYRSFTVPDPAGVVIFYHGGGPYGGAGYIDFCLNASRNSSVNIYLVDIRGSGQSGGPRGDGPSKRRFLKDIEEVVDAAMEDNPGLPSYLAGHSSGAGMILNYGTSRYSREDLAGFFFLSPWFGHRSETERIGDDLVFQEREKWPFIANRISFGMAYGHHESVVYHYPKSRKEKDSPLVTGNSVNMARAVIPARPAAQLSRLNGRCTLWIGEKDEVVDVKKLLWFYRENAPDSDYYVFEDYRHLSLMLCDNFVFPLSTDS